MDWLGLTQIDSTHDFEEVGTVLIKIEEIVSIQQAWSRQEDGVRIVHGSIVNLSVGRHTVKQSVEEIVELLTSVES